MRSLRRVGLATAVLTDEEIEYIDKKIVETVRPLLIGRQLFPVDNIGHAGFRKITFYTEEDMSAAVIDMEAQQESLDRVTSAPHTVDIPSIHKECVLFWRDLAMRRELGQPIDLTHARNAARQVAEAEDLFLLSGEHTGFPALGVEGLSTATGRNTTSGGDWSANYLTYVSAAITELETDGHYGPYKLILTPTWNQQLRQLLTDYTDKWAFQAVGDLIGGVENILISANLKASDGGVDSVLLVEPGADNFDLIVGEDVHTRNFELKNGNIWCQVREVVAPRIKRPASICEITTLT